MNLVRLPMPILLSALALSGCVSVMKTLHLATFNEVLLGVKANDANKVREAARQGVVFDDGIKAIDSSNICGELPLHLAIQKNNLEITQILLQEGANPNLPSEIPREPSMCQDLGILDTPAGLPPMHYAITLNKPEFAEALLFAGADPDSKTADGKTALALASDRKGFELLTAYVRSPVHLAARIGDEGSLRAAARRGDALTSRMVASNTTPLEEALLARKFRIVEFLVENAAAQEPIASTEARKAVDEYLTEASNSPVAGRLRQLATPN